MWIIWIDLVSSKNIFLVLLHKTRSSQNGICLTLQMCHIMIFFTTSLRLKVESNQYVLFCHVLNNVGFPLKGKLIKSNSDFVCLRFRIQRSVAALYFGTALVHRKCTSTMYRECQNHRVHKEWQFYGVHSIMMVKSAKPGEDGGCTPSPFSLYLSSRTKLWSKPQVGPYRKCCHVQTKAPGDDF